MDDPSTMRPIGATGELASPPGEAAPTPHGDVVLEALSVPARMLIAGVILANLTLGAVLIAGSDFSEVRPQGEAKATQALEGDAGMRVTAAATNDRD